MLNQFQFCEDNGIPFCAVIGESELQQGVVTLRDMSTRTEVRLFNADLQTRSNMSLIIPFVSSAKLLRNTLNSTFRRELNP